MKSRDGEYILLMLLNLLRIQLIKRLQRQLEIRKQRVAARAREILTHNDAQHLHFLRVRRHGVGGDDPAALAELMGTIIFNILAHSVRSSARQIKIATNQPEEGGVKRKENLHIKLIILLPQILINPTRHKRQPRPTPLAHNNETQILQVRSKIIRRARQIQHNTPVPTLAQADKLVILADNLACTAGKVERKRRLVSAQVVDVEDELLRQVLGVAPHDPADTGVHEAVFVAGDVD